MAGRQPPRLLWPIPYLARTGTIHLGAINLRWLPNDRLWNRLGGA
ncbi:MAG TPA: hypothetical protein VG817_07565 [Gemmatimonadales bacterium]|nr:hypothetical protein [Gemmatimonadales bacterium]